MTQLLLSDHSLAEVQLRYSERHRPSVPRHWRLCRFCRNDVEDACHAMFVCEQSNDLVGLCMAFLTSVMKMVPELQGNSDVKSFFGLILRHNTAVNLLAKYSHDILQIYGAQEVYIVHPSVFENNTVQDPVQMEVSDNKML